MMSLPENIYDFLLNELPKIASQIDRDNEVPKSFLEKMKELKLFGLNKYGIEAVYQAIRLSSRSSPAVGHIISIGNIVSIGREELYGEENSLFSLNVTEPGGGTDIRSNLKTEADEREDGSAIINGEKVFGSNAQYGDKFIILAKGPKGPTLYVADRQPGIKVEPMDLISFRGSGISHVYLKDVRAVRIGTPGKGIREALELINYERFGYGLIALGISEGVLMELESHAFNKKIFGKELGEFQSVKWMIAEIEAKMELLNSFVNATIEKIRENGHIDPIDAAVSKIVAGELAQRATWVGVQLLGGKGLTYGTTIERLARDARSLDIAGGAREVILDFIGDYAIKKYKQFF